MHRRRYILFRNEIIKMYYRYTQKKQCRNCNNGTEKKEGDIELYCEDLKEYKLKTDTCDDFISNGGF